MTLRRFVKKLPAVLQTEVQKEFYAATFDQLFNPANVEAAQGFIGRRTGDVLDPLKDNYLEEPTKERAAYQLEPIAYAVNAALEDTNHFFYEDLINYIEHKGGNVGNHGRMFADNYYSFAPPIDVDKYLNYQNYLWLPGDGSDPTNTAPIGFLNTDGSLSPAAYDAIIESRIVGATTFNTSEATGLVPQNFEFTSGMRLQFVGSASYNKPYYVEGVGRAIRLVEEESPIYKSDDIDITLQPTLLTPGQEPIPDPAAEQNLLATPDYITVERGSVEGSAWARSNRWFHEDSVDAITLLGQLQGGTIISGGAGYDIGDVLLVNIGDGTLGSFVVTSVSLGGVIDGISVFTRGSGYTFAIVDETGTPSPVEELAWDNSDPFGLGSGWDPDNILANPSGYLTIATQDETDFDNQVIGGSVSLGGTGYTVSDTLTIVGGTGTPATFTVTSVDALDGAVTGITLFGSGSYSAIPTTPAVTSGGTGLGCLINLSINGDFDGGSAFVDPGDIGKFIALSDGTIISIDAVVANVITEFTIVSSSSTILPSSGTTLTMAGTDAVIRITTNSSGELDVVELLERGSGYHAGGVITVSNTLGGAGGQLTYTVANGRIDTISVTAIGAGYVADSIANLNALDVPTATSTDAAGTGFEMYLASANERGVTLWDDNTITTGSGAGAYIEGNLAAAVSRSNKAERPILEFKRDLDLFDYGTRYLTTVDVAATTETFGDIVGQATGLKVDGVTLTTGMRLIFLDPDTIVTFLNWDETPGTTNDAWDETTWESSGASGAITRFVWEVDATGPTLDLIQYDPLIDDVAGVGYDGVALGDNVTVTSGDTWAGYDFYQYIDSDTEEYKWRAGQEKTNVNQAMLYQLYDTSGIALNDELEYPDNAFAGSEIFSYKLLTQARLNELGGGVLVDDAVLGFPVETKGFRQLGDIIFENDLEANRENYIPIGGSETEIRGYYYFRQYEVDELRLADFYNPSFMSANSASDNPVIGNNYQTNWRTSSVPEEQRVVDRYLTTSATEDTFAVSVAPPADREACLVVSRGRRLNTTEYAYLASTQEVKLLSPPTEYSNKIGNGTSQTFVFDIQDNLEITIREPGETTSDYKELGVDYTITDDTPGNIIVFFTEIPVAGAFIQATNRTSGAPGLNEVVEILTCTNDSLPENSIGYFEIPNGLENNPNNTEIIEQSWNEFTPHFTSIITEQDVYEGDAFGAGNNYRDTAKDGSLGTYALQSQSPMLKTMFCASNSNLDIVDAIRFSSSEYTRFKNKYVKTAQQLINEGFQPFSASNPIDVSEWVDEILRRITRGREYANAFSDTYMIAWNNVYQDQTIVGTGLATDFTSTNFVDLTDKRNTMYLYVDGVIQQIDRDYTITNTNPIQFSMTTAPALGAELVIRLYENSAPAHIPATPTKLGLYPAFKPGVETDNTYLTPATVIIGHDGSRTPIYGSEVDDLLLEMETRIYNGILDKFRLSIESGDAGDYNIPLKVDTYKPGKFRETRWSLTEWNDLVKQSFYKWSASCRADYITNGYYDNANEWSYNYGEALDVDGEQLPAGFWRGVFDYYYDTQTPESTPWEMLGFVEKPVWWESCTPRIGDTLSDGTTEFVGYGAGPWPATDEMWIDIEAGRIRREYDPVEYEIYVETNATTGDSATEFPDWVAGSIDERYARPDLVAKYLPVDGLGALKATPLEAIDVTASLTLPNNVEAADDYTWGDWAPIEYAWRTSESYPFAAIEALFLARPGEFGEKFWDPEHIYEVPVDREQIVNDESDLRKRIGNDELYVHGETLGGIAQVNSGYQVWITGRLRTLKKDPAADFGDLLRTLDVKLGHKMAGFTDKDTLRVFVEGISVSSQATNLLIPSENIDVALYTGSPAQDYFYGGVLIKALSDNTYQLFGYDVLKGQFDYYERNDMIGVSSVNVGGNPASFRIYETGTEYQTGDIIKLNGIFYKAKEAHVSDSFDPALWTKLQSLPVSGGIGVTHKPNSTDNLLSLKYGEKLVGPQAIFDFLIGWGDYLERQGWTFEDPGANGELNDWYKVAKDFLLWAGTQWEEGSLIMLSPGGEKAVLNAQEGYPGNVERVSNGVYSILNKEGVAIDPINTVINREDRLLEVEPAIAQTGIYGLRVSTFETENIVTFDNVTEFNDTIYDPVLGSRLARLDFRGRRTLDWTGKLEAAGFIITADGLLPNYENMVDSIRNYHNTEVQLDQPQLESVARHLIGFDDRDYFTDLGVLDDAQFQFYQGLVRQKGTRQAIEKLERNQLVTSIDDELNVVEEWALKVGEFGGVCKNQFTEFLIAASEVKDDPQLVQLSYPASSTDTRTRAFEAGDVDIGAETITISGHGWRTGDGKVYNENTSTAPSPLVDGSVYYVYVVDENTISLATTWANATAATPVLIDLSAAGSGTTQTFSHYPSGRVTGIHIVSSGNTFTSAPTVFIDNHPDDTIGSGASATSVLDTDGTLLRIDVLTPGSGYSKPPIVSVGNPTVTAGDDRAIAEIDFDITTDIASDDVIIIDIDDESRWITKPTGPACDVAAEIWPEAAEGTYRTTNAGYVHKDDITFTAFDTAAVDNVINNTTLAFEHGQTVWMARNPRETFAVYHMDNYRASTIAAQDETDFDNTGDNGTWFGGTDYVSTERIIMSDGTEILIDTVDGNGAVLTFDVDVASSSPFPARGSHVLTAVSSNVAGNNDFTLTIGTANEQTTLTNITALVTGAEYKIKRVGTSDFTAVGASSNTVGTTFVATGVGTGTGTADLTGDAATITMTGDGTATLTSLPREDVIKAQFEFEVSGTPSGQVTGVTVLDGGFGYKSAGSFTISRDTYGAERTTNDTDAIISYTVANGIVTGASVDTPGTGYARNVSTVVLNANGSGYAIDDILTVTGGTELYGSTTLTVTELTTVATQDETNFNAIPANEGTFNAGTGHTAGDIITLTDGSTITVDAATVSTIASQTALVDFDGAGSNGTHNGAGATANQGDKITMSDGTVVQVTDGAAPGVAAAAITDFKIISTTTSTQLDSGETISQVSTTGYGAGLTITLGTNNEQTTAEVGLVTEFTVTTASTSGITSDNATLVQQSTDGLGVGFAINMGQANQGVYALDITFLGSYSTDPATPGTATTVVPSGGTGCTVDLTIIGDNIPILEADVTRPIGWGRYLGNTVPDSGSIFADGVLYDYEITSGLNVNLTKDGEDVADGTIAAGTPFFTLMNLRYKTTAERTLFETEMALAGVSQVWIDDNNSGLWETDEHTGSIVYTPATGAGVELLADFDGADGATAFTEESFNAAVATFNGGAELDTAQFNTGTASLLLDGVDSDVTFPDIAAYDLSTNEWTMEGFVRLNTIPPNTGSGGAGFALATLSYDDGGAELLSYVLAQDGFGTRVMARYAGTFEQNTTSMSINTWYHWAMVKTTANGIRLYFDGNYRTGDFGAISNDMGTSSVALQIGARSAAEYVDGWIDDVRFTNGTALYTGTGSYTIPAAPFATPGPASLSTTTSYTALRAQEDLIETFKFENAYVYEDETKDTLAQIPVYDPFKGILPGNAAQNLKYINQRDPAKYSTAIVGGDTLEEAAINASRQVNADLLFDGDQLGELWWDTSTSAYVYYEQSTDTYRRDNWGKLFPGSSVDIYEWTRSASPPADWDGDGTVRSTTDYTVKEEWDSILEEVRTFYYFWVKDRTEIPEGVNRTVAAFEVANIITNPVANLYQWFSPISQTAFMFAGVDNVFTDSNNVFQINYRRTDDERPTHVEWELGRDSDASYEVNDIHWNKMVDSLCGFTDEIDLTAKAYTDAIATFNTDATGIDLPTANAITSLAAHGFTDGAGVVYSKNGGVENIGLTEGTTYYVEVISDTEFALHNESHLASPIPPVTVNPASRVSISSSGAEVHTLTQSTVATNNHTTSVIPTAADATRGYLIVPDPTLSTSQQLGIQTRPMQSMFVNILDARRVWRDKVNELTNDIILRDAAPTWNSTLTTNNLWEWVDWYADGYDVTNTVPVRQVDDTSDLALLTDTLDGDLVKVTGTRYSVYEYDADNDTYTLVAREASRLNILEDVYTSDPSLENAIEIREIIEALRQNVFTGNLAVYNNSIFFAMLNYVFSEQDDLDWAFKSTYIFLDQTGRRLEQDRVFQEDPFDAALDYITEAKPYHSKIRDFRITRRTDTDIATGTVDETERLMTPFMVYDQIRGGDLSVTEMRIAKYEMTLDTSWKGYTTLFDSGSIIDVRLGAAGRAVNNYRDVWADIQGPTGGNTAVIEVEFSGGQLISAIIIDAGSGYTANTVGATFTLNATSDGGDGLAEISYDVNAYGQIENLGIVALGSTYNSVFNAVEIVGGGTGYTLADVLTVSGGTGTAATLTVTSVNAGVITGVSVATGGSYSVSPTNPVSVTGGTGANDATFNLSTNVDITDMPVPNTGTTLAEFDPAFTGIATTTEELEAVSAINAAITEEFFFDYQGSFLRNTSFGGYPTLDSFEINPAPAGPSGSGYVAGEILALDAGSGVPVSNALFSVTSVDGGGGITGLTLVNGGSYIQTPTVDPVNLNGGSGTGASVTTLIFENGSAVPWDSIPYDQIGFESSAGDENVTALTGSPDGLATTIPGQTASDYDGTGENGSFTDGTSYSADFANGAAVYPSGLSFANNDPSPDTITRTDGNSFVTTDGIEEGMQIIVINATDSGNNGTYNVATVTDTVITLDTSNVLTTDAGDTSARFSFHDVITMTDGTLVRVDTQAAGVVTGFTIIAGSDSYLPSESTITQLSVSGGTGVDFSLTLGVANETSGTFADVPAEETFSGTGNQKEFTILTDTPTYFMFAVVDGVQQVLNVDYFFIGDTLTFVSILDTNGQRAFGAPPAGTDNIELYTYIEAGDLINPQVTAGITEEMVPLDPRENLVLIADTHNVALNAAGTGYSVGDILTVVGGTFTTATTLLVTEVDGGGAGPGAITGVTLIDSGEYTVLPGAAATTTSTSAGGGGSPDSFILAQTGDDDGLNVEPLQYTSNADQTSWVERAITETDETDANPRYGIAYDGSGVWVSVGEGDLQGDFTTSLETTFRSTDDGATWVVQTTDAQREMYAVAYGAGLFVAGGETGNLETSADGITWTARTSGIANNIRAIHWTGTTFIAVGDGDIITSADGITWAPTATQPPGGPYYYSVDSNGSRWFVGTDRFSTVDSTVYYSDDSGATWNAPTGANLNPQDITGVANDGAGTVVAVGRDGGVLRSTDNGASYTDITANVAGAAYNDVIYDYGATSPIGFVIGGWNDGGLTNAFIATSLDGSAWTTRVTTSTTANGVLSLAGKNPVASAGGSGATIDVTDSSYSFRVHYDTLNNVTFTRNADSASTTLTSNIALTDNTIPVVSTASFTTATRSDPQVAWLGTERIVYHGQTSTSLTGVVRGTVGTHAQAALTGTRVYDGNAAQAIPVDPYIYWVDSATASYNVTNPPGGFDAEWRYHGNNLVHFFLETAASTIHTDDSIVVGDTLRCLTGNSIQNSYFIKDLIDIGEVSKIDIDDMGSGYSVGDIISTATLDGTLSPTTSASLVVQGVDVDGGVTHVGILDRGTGYTSGNVNFLLTGIGDGTASITVYTDREGLALAIGGDIINALGLVVERNNLSWAADRALPGGLLAATTPAAVTIQSESGNAIRVDEDGVPLP